MAAIDSLETLVASLSNPKNHRVALDINEQRRVVRLLSRCSDKYREKSMELFRTLLDHGLLTNAVSSQLIDFFAAIKSVDGLLTIVEKVSDLSEANIVKILIYAITPQNGTTPPVVNSEHASLLIRAFGYPYSASLLTRELQILSSDQVLTLLRITNFLFAHLLVTAEESQNAPTINQVVDFLNCILDAAAKSILTAPAVFEKEIEFSWRLVDSSVKSLSILAQARARRDAASSSAVESRKRKDYSIQVLVFK